MHDRSMLLYSGLHGVLFLARCTEFHAPQRLPKNRKSVVKKMGGSHHATYVRTQLSCDARCSRTSVDYCATACAGSCSCSGQPARRCSVRFSLCLLPLKNAYSTRRPPHLRRGAGAPSLSYHLSERPRVVAGWIWTAACSHEQDVHSLDETNSAWRVGVATGHQRTRPAPVRARNRPWAGPVRRRLAFVICDFLTIHYCRCYRWRIDVASSHPTCIHPLTVDGRKQPFPRRL